MVASFYVSNESNFGGKNDRQTDRWIYVFIAVVLLFIVVPVETIAGQYDGTLKYAIAEDIVVNLQAYTSGQNASVKQVIDYDYSLARLGEGDVVTSMFKCKVDDHNYQFIQAIDSQDPEGTYSRTDAIPDNSVVGNVEIQLHWHEGTGLPGYGTIPVNVYWTE